MELTEVPRAAEIARLGPRAALRARWKACLVDVFALGATILIVNGVVPASLHEAYPDLGLWFALSVVVIYYWLPESIWGTTPGKLLLKIRVVDGAAQPPGPGRALVRTLFRFLEVNPFLAGAIPAGLVAYFSKRGQRIGDLLAGTYVLRLEDLAPGAVGTSQEARATKSSSGA